MNKLCVLLSLSLSVQLPILCAAAPEDKKDCVTAQAYLEEIFALLKRDNTELKTTIITKKEAVKQQQSFLIKDQVELQAQLVRVQSAYLQLQLQSQELELQLYLINQERQLNRISALRQNALRLKQGLQLGCADQKKLAESYLNRAQTLLSKDIYFPENQALSPKKKHGHND